MDKLGLGSLISDAEKLETLLLQSPSIQSGTGSTHPALSLDSTLEDILTAGALTQIMSQDAATARGDLWIADSTPKMTPLNIGAAYTHLESDGSDLAYQANLTLANDAYLHLGPAPGGSLEYDSGTSHVLATGADWNMTLDLGLGREPISKLAVSDARNALTDLANPANYHAVLDNPADDTGEGVGLGFFTSTGINDVGASLVFVRTDLESKGELRFYTKQSTANATPPALVLTLQDDGQALFQNIVNINTVGGGGELLAVRDDTDGGAGIELVNASAGTSAAANVRVKNVAGAGGDDAANFGITGTSRTPLGTLDTADTGVFQTGENVSGGLLVRTQHTTAPLVLAVNTDTEIFRATPTAMVFNDGGDDIDWRVESNNQTHMLFVDAGADAVGIRASNPALSAAGLYVPFIAGDALPTLYIGDTASDQTAIYAISGTGIGLDVDLDSTGTIARFNDGGAPILTIQDGGNILLTSPATLDLNGIADCLILDTDGDTTISAPTDDIIDFQCGGSDVATLTPATLSIAQYLAHLGDADTHWQFQTDQATLVCGGVTMLDAVEAASDYVAIFPSVSRGLLGLGTTASLTNWDSTWAILRIGDQAAIANNPNAGGYFASNLYYDGSDWRYIESDNASLYTQSAGRHLFSTVSSGTAGNVATLSSRIMVLNTGDVGIGTSTPGSPLELNFATENLEFVDAGSAGATEQDWIEVQVGGVTGYIRVYASK
jgi:hypothetical protein